MLASLLPGLRDIRTPLTVGYLWLIIAWLLWADDLPKQRPPGNGPISRIFDLSHILGATATIAAVSFVAYVLGALVTIPTDSRIFVRIVDLIPSLSHNLRLTRLEYQHHIQGKVQEYLSKLPADQRDALPGRLQVGASKGVYDYALWTVVARPQDRLLTEGYSRDFLSFQKTARAALITDLRARLLVRNQEMYGEYDRLAAEAAFRINLCLPLIMLGVLVGTKVDWWWAPVTIAMASILLFQGLTRLGLSVAVLLRMIVEGIIDDPLLTRMHELLHYDGDSLDIQEDSSPGPLH